MDKRARRTALIIVILAALALLLAGGQILLRGGGAGQLRRTLFGAESFADWDGTAVFLGDSITDFCDLEYYYPGLNAVNAGISGDVTGHMRERLEESVLAFEPDILVLLGGINDLYTGASDDEIVANLTAIVDETLARFPDAAVLVQSIYPVADGWDHTVTGRIQAINGRLEALAEEHGYTYVDVYSALCTADGQMKEEYSYDGLHPNDAGYQAVRPVLTAALEAVTARGLLG